MGIHDGCACVVGLPARKMFRLVDVGGSDSTKNTIFATTFHLHLDVYKTYAVGSPHFVSQSRVDDCRYNRSASIKQHGKLLELG